MNTVSAAAITMADGYTTLNTEQRWVVIAKATAAEKIEYDSLLETATFFAR